MIDVRATGMALVRYRNQDELRLAYLCDNSDLALVLYVSYPSLSAAISREVLDIGHITKIVFVKYVAGSYPYQIPYAIHRLVLDRVARRYPSLQFHYSESEISLDVDDDLKLAEDGSKLLRMKDLNRRRRRKTSPRGL